MGATYQIGIFFGMILIINADWVEIPQSKPFTETSTKRTGSTFLSDIKTPVNIVFNTEQVEALESFNSTSTLINKRVTPEEISQLETNIPRKNRITIKPAKSYIMEVFSSSTTQFTPLMSSISDSSISSTTETPLIKTKSSTTTAAPTKPTVLAKTTTTTTTLSSRKPVKTKTITAPTKPYLRRTSLSNNNNNNRNKTKENVKLKNHSDGIEIEDAPSNKDETLENREIPDVGSFSSYAGFLPFLKSIQTTLMQRAHKSIKSKIQVLIDLRDNLLYEIDQRIQKLWYKKETSEARGYKEDYHHMDFPSNEAALITLGFLTLAVFLVKLVLKVIAAIKAKKAYYTTTTTTTMATTGRKKRDINEYDELDIDSTYRILSAIDNFPLKYGYN